MTEVKMSAMEAVIMAKLKQRAAERGVTLASIPSAIVRQKIMPMVETKDHKAAFQSNRLWLDMSTHFKPRTLELKGETLIEWLRNMSRGDAEHTTGPRKYIASVAETVTDLTIEVDDDMNKAPAAAEPVIDLALERFRPFKLLSYFGNVQTLTIRMQRDHDPQAHEWSTLTHLASASLLFLPQLRSLKWDSYGDFNLPAHEEQLSSVLRMDAVADNLQHLESLTIHGPCLGKNAGEALAAVLPETLQRLVVAHVRVTPTMLQTLDKRCPALQVLGLSGSARACAPGLWKTIFARQSAGWRQLSTTVPFDDDDLDTVKGDVLSFLTVHWRESNVSTTKRAFLRLLYRSPKLQKLHVICEAIPTAEDHEELQQAIRKAATESCPSLKNVQFTGDS